MIALSITIVLSFFSGCSLLAFALREHFIDGETLVGAFVGAGVSMLVCFIVTMAVYYVG